MVNTLVGLFLNVSVRDLREGNIDPLTLYVQLLKLLWGGEFFCGAMRGWKGGIVILARFVFHFIREHENLV